MHGHRMGRALGFGAELPQIALCLLVAAAFPACRQIPANSASHELLYVLDTDNSGPNAQEHLLAVDPQRKVVVRRYEGIGLGLDFALSADGKRLYLARSIEAADGENLGKLDVIDTATGAILATVDNSQRWVTKGPYRYSAMALSADGRWLYVHKFKPESDHAGTQFLAIFDTTNNRFLPDVISLPQCAVPTLVPWPNSRALSILCSGYSDTPNLWTVRFNEEGVPTAQATVDIPIPEERGRRRPAMAFVSGENEVTVLMTDGRYARLNSTTGSTLREGHIEFSPLLTPPGWQPQVPGAEHVPSLGRRVVGPTHLSQGKLHICLLRTDRYMHAADAIAVVNATTLQQEVFLELKSSFWNPSWNLVWDLAVGNGGKRLYLLAVEGKSGSIRVLTVPEGTELERIRNVGATPTMIVPSS